MRQSGVSGRLSPRVPLDGQGSALPVQNFANRARQRELEQKLAALQKDHAELHTALFEAAQVHRRLCAPRLLRYGNFEIASEIFAVRQLPGDFFTAEEAPSGVMLALGDICGKGLAAGMWITHLAGLVGTHAAAYRDPQQVVSAINSDLCRISSLMPLTSLFLARLDPFSGALDYVSAGHPPAFLLRADGEITSLSEGGPLLGVVPAALFVRGRVDLHSGDLLMIYSDGVLDSLDDTGNYFGYDRLKEQLRLAAESTADGALFSVLGAVQDFAAGHPLTDDLSLVIVRRLTG